MKVYCIVDCNGIGRVSGSFGAVARALRQNVEKVGIARRDCSVATVCVWQKRSNKERTHKANKSKQVSSRTH